MSGVNPAGSKSAMGYALEGMMRASKQLEGAAEETLRATTVGADPGAAQQTPPASLERAAIGTITSRTAYTANAKMVKAADEMLGSLMDIVA